MPYIMTGIQGMISAVNMEKRQHHAEIVDQTSFVRNCELEIINSFYYFTTKKRLKIRKENVAHNYMF